MKFPEDICCAKETIPTFAKRPQKDTSAKHRELPTTARHNNRSSPKFIIGLPFLQKLWSTFILRNTGPEVMLWKPLDPFVISGSGADIFVRIPGKDYGFRHVKCTVSWHLSFAEHGTTV